jgi:hypothetical protein
MWIRWVQPQMCASEMIWRYMRGKRYRKLLAEGVEEATAVLPNPILVSRLADYQALYLPLKPEFTPYLDLDKCLS